MSRIAQQAMTRHLQRARQQLEANNPLVAVEDGNSTTFMRIAQQPTFRPVAVDLSPSETITEVDPDQRLSVQHEMEAVMVDDIVMSANVRHWLIVSGGPVDITFDPSQLRYRLTGPNIRERLHRAVVSAGERPLMESDIASGLQMTATEVAERQHAAEQEWNRERARQRAAAEHYVTKVDRKAKAALWRYLNEKQHEDLFCLGHFVVNGGKSKMAYKILKGRQGNVYRDDDARFCLTHGDLPVWDLMLAQKLMIEDSEPRFLEQANRLDEIPF